MREFFRQLFIPLALLTTALALPPVQAAPPQQDSQLWQDQFCLGSEQCAVGDFNGDGRTDIAAFLRSTQIDDRQGDVLVALSNGSSFSGSLRWQDLFCLRNQVCAVGDFNGDGRDDLVAFIRSSESGAAEGDVFVALSSGLAFGNSNRWQSDFCFGNQICTVGDANGDGRDDVIAFVREPAAGEPSGTRGDVLVALSAGDRFQTPRRWNDLFCINQEICAVGDFNGDGRADIITFVRETKTGDGRGDVIVALSDGSNFVSSTRWQDFFCTGEEQCAVGNFNGDSTDDIAAFVRDTKDGDARGDVYVASSVGTAFSESTLRQSFFCIGDEVCAVGDANGDGQDDLIAFARDTKTGDGRGDVYVSLSPTINRPFKVYLPSVRRLT